MNFGVDSVHGFGFCDHFAIRSDSEYSDTNFFQETASIVSEAEGGDAPIEDGGEVEGWSGTAIATGHRCMGNMCIQFDMCVEPFCLLTLLQLHKMGNMLVKMGHKISPPACFPYCGSPKHAGSPKNQVPVDLGRPQPLVDLVVLLVGGQSTAGNSNFGESMNVLKMRGLPVGKGRNAKVPKVFRPSAAKHGGHQALKLDYPVMKHVKMPKETEGFHGIVHCHLSSLEGIFLKHVPSTKHQLERAHVVPLF